MTTEQILRLADLYGQHRGLARATVSTYAANDGKLFADFAEKQTSCTLRRAAAIMRWFSDNWPADLEWPPHIPRPAHSKDAA